MTADTLAIVYSTAESTIARSYVIHRMLQFLTAQNRRMSLLIVLVGRHGWPRSHPPYEHLVRTTSQHVRSLVGSHLAAGTAATKSATAENARLSARSLSTFSAAVDALHPSRCAIKDTKNHPNVCAFAGPTLIVEDMNAANIAVPGNARQRSEQNESIDRSMLYPSSTEMALKQSMYV